LVLDLAWVVAVVTPQAVMMRRRTQAGIQTQTTLLVQLTRHLTLVMITPALVVVVVMMMMIVTLDSQRSQSNQSSQRSCLRRRSQTLMPSRTSL
jgi:uncharacterized membrane protein YhaH (DUF805 family)